MKISSIVIALVIVFATSCTGEKAANEHGHDHGKEEHTHDHDNHHEQEEFTVTGDSIEVVIDSTDHVHEDGSSHHNH